MTTQPGEFREGFLAERDIDLGLKEYVGVHQTGDGRREVVGEGILVGRFSMFKDINHEIKRKKKI